MSLLAPFFLLGLLALVVPILVHLRHRERKVALPFPSLMFLSRVPFRSMRRQRLEHLLLFAVRCLALALLALAFARPFLPGTGVNAATASGARARVVLLDRSYSMAYGERWQRALSAARQAVDGLGPGERAGLVFFGEQAAAAVSPTAELASVRAALASARVSAEKTRFGPALKLAADWLSAAEAPRREVVLISDFQRAGWDARDEQARLPEGVGLSWVDVSEPDTRNVALAGATLGRDFADGRERVLISARVASKTNVAENGRRVRLVLDGRVVQERPVDVAPMSAVSVGFDPFPVPPGTTRGMLSLDADALPLDDVLHFVIAPGQDVPVLLVEGQSPRPYLRRALAIGDRPRFRVETRSSGSFGAGDLAGRSVVVFDGVLPSAGAMRPLLDWVRAGGAVLVLGAPGGSARDAGAGAGLLPGSFGRAIDRMADAGATLAHLDYDHPVFETFKGPRAGDFSSARFLRYRAFQPEAEARTLARFDDGTPALVEVPSGKGRVLVWTSSLDGISNDLPLQPIFLPLVHQLVKYAAGHAEPRAWYTVGEVVGVRREGARADVLTLTAPSGERLRLGAADRFLALREPGFYEVLPERSAVEAQAFAVNVDVTESDLARIDPEELAAAVKSAARGAGSSTAIAEGPEDVERRQALWRWAIAAVLLLLTAESVLARRVARATAG